MIITERNDKVLISLSGGLDSLVLLVLLLSDGYTVECVNFQYGSKHNMFEMKAAQDIAYHYGVRLMGVDLRTIFQFMHGASALMSGNSTDIPEGHYNEKTMKQTVVPGRNGIFMMVLAALAESGGFSYIATGVHKGDHHIYPDCRTEYCETMARAIGIQSERRVDLLTPFHNMDKTGIVAVGNVRKVPFELSRTCYKEQPLPCGKCGSCRERLEAFELNGLTDPVQYTV